MKGFGIDIKNDLLDPKHVEGMGQAVWLYMWLIDHMTSITEEGIGKVLGGKPIKFREMKDELGISPDTYSRWVDKLLEYPYIEVIRAPYGIIFKVLKAKKHFRKKGERYRKNAESEIGRDTAYMRNVIKTRQGESIFSEKKIPEQSSELLDKNTKKMKKNGFGYSEKDSSDSYEDVVDSESGEIVPDVIKTDKNEAYWKLLNWSKERRGSGFMNVKKQFGAFKMARLAGIQPNELQERWIEFESNKFRIENGFDWRDVVNSFDKKR